MFVFFFQAEDGIRDFHVTGVQTCALPIYSGIQVVRMPEDLAGWDHALETGEANIHEMAAPPEDDGERADSIPTDALPLAVINGAERFPVTTSDGIGTEGELVTLTWPGKVAFPGDRARIEAPAAS